MTSRYAFSNRIGTSLETNALARALARARDAGVEPLNMAESNPTRCGLSPGGVLEALSNPASLSYEPDPRGLASTRRALAARIGCGPDDLFLSAGTSEAYSWLFKLLCDPGDAILVPRPGYPLFEYLAGLESVRSVPYRLEYDHGSGWHIDMDELRAAALTSGARAIVVIHPNNPTGSYVSAAERGELVGFCADAGLSIVSDEVFLPYRLDEADARTLGGETRCPVYVLDGLSKLLCLPQLKLGWIRLSGPAGTVAEAGARLEIIADTFLSVGAPVMHALPALLPKADAFVAAVRERLLVNLDRSREVFGGTDSPFRVRRCGGGWAAILEYPRILPEEELVLSLLREEGVFAHPGHFYDFEREGFLALSLLLEPPRFSDGAEAILRFFRRYLG